MKRGPRLFENQIFVDVFDGEGHHDKILDNSKSVDIIPGFSRIKEKYLLVKRELPEIEEIGKISF